MKNNKLKIFTIFILMLLQTQVFCEEPGNGGGGGDSGSIIAAINDLRDKTLDALQGSADYSIVQMLNKIFIAKDGAQSVIGASVDMYANNFYSLYAKDSDFLKKLEINDEKEINSIPSSTANDASNSDLISIENNVNTRTKEMLAREIYYDTQKSIIDRIKDMFALLLVKAEGGNNNINPDTVMDDQQTLKSKADGGTPYGSLEQVDPKKQQVNPDIQDILNANALIGHDGYSEDEANNARIFINQLIQSAPPPKTFDFPTIKSNKSSNSLDIYLPYKDTTNNTPYTKVQISTKQPDNCAGGGTCLSPYASMLDTVNKSSKFQEYKMKFRAKMALRTLYFDAIFRAFQERYKGDNAKNKSLLEKENEMALIGLTQTYYANLKNKSVADINLETLHTLNKIVYFLYKLHQDSSRAQLITSISGIQTQPLDSQDESTYLKPVGSLIENGCWDLGDSSVSPNGITDLATRKTNCTNALQ